MEPPPFEVVRAFRPYSCGCFDWERWAGGAAIVPPPNEFKATFPSWSAQNPIGHPQGYYFTISVSEIKTIVLFLYGKERLRPVFRNSTTKRCGQEPNPSFSCFRTTISLAALNRRTGTGYGCPRFLLSMAANRFPRKKTSPIRKQRERACRATFARIPFNLACKVRNDRLMFNLGSTMRRETTGLQRSRSAPGNPGLRASATRRTS